jgi:hypothetical protein
MTNVQSVALVRKCILLQTRTTMLTIAKRPAAKCVATVVSSCLTWVKHLLTGNETTQMEDEMLKQGDRCPVCGQQLVLTPSGWLACPLWHGRRHLSHNTAATQQERRETPKKNAHHIGGRDPDSRTALSGEIISRSDYAGICQSRHSCCRAK